MKESRISNSVAKVVASWLRKDVNLNMDTVSSSHMYEPPVPAEMKNIQNTR